MSVRDGRRDAIRRDFALEAITVQVLICTEDTEWFNCSVRDEVSSVDRSGSAGRSAILIHPSMIEDRDPSFLPFLARSKNQI